jgi:hypothetical protein
VDSVQAFAVGPREDTEERPIAMGLRNQGPRRIASLGRRKLEDQGMFQFSGATKCEWNVQR